MKPGLSYGTAGSPSNTVAARSEGRSVLPVPQPVQFGYGAGWLAGQYQPAVLPPGSTVDAGLTRAEHAVLLCNPFGQEAVRCHRAFRVVAEKLARSGIASLRFDYFGTGDSAGDDGDGDLKRWRQDIALAHEALRERSGAARITWAGLCLGAALALEAAEEVDDPPALVVLWDPVVEGRQYLVELSERHAFWTRNRGVTDEALGFLLPDRFRTQVAAIDLLKSSQAGKRDLAILIGADVARKDALLQHLQQSRPETRCVVTDQTTVWCSNEALGSQWVPSASLEALVQLIQERR